MDFNIYIYVYYEYNQIYGLDPRLGNLNYKLNKFTEIIIINPL